MFTICEKGHALPQKMYATMSADGNPKYIFIDPKKCNYCGAPAATKEFLAENRKTKKSLSKWLGIF